MSNTAAISGVLAVRIGGYEECDRIPLQATVRKELSEALLTQGFSRIRVIGLPGQFHPEFESDNNDVYLQVDDSVDAFQCLYASAREAASKGIALFQHELFDDGLLQVIAKSQGEDVVVDVIRTPFLHSAFSTKATIRLGINEYLLCLDSIYQQLARAADSAPGLNTPNDDNRKP